MGPPVTRRLVAAAAVLALAASGCRRAPPPEPVDLVLPRAVDGKPFSFGARRGEATLIYFFTTWCVTCQAVEPAVAEVARRGAKEGIDVVGVALDLEGRRIVEPYVRATDPPYPVVVGGGRVARGESPFGKIPELPAFLYLDREGRPAAAVTGIASPDDLLARARDVRERG